MYSIQHISNLYTNLVNNIWSGESAELQTEFLYKFPDLYRKCNADYLVNSRAFLLLDNNQLLNFTDDPDTLIDPQVGLYTIHGKCIFNNRLVFPIVGFDSKVYGFVGYDNGNACKTVEDKVQLVPYLYSSGKAFNKDRFWFMTRDEYLAAYYNGYICLVDGIFDKITLQTNGLNAASLLGSHVSKYHQDYLRYIKNWIVFSDSDLAGNRLYEICKRYNPNTVQITVSNAKDIDERLREDPNAKRILQNLVNTLKKEAFIFNHNIEEFVF